MNVIEVREDLKWILHYKIHEYEVHKIRHAVFFVYAGTRHVATRASLAACEAWVEGQHPDPEPTPQVTTWYGACQHCGMIGALDGHGQCVSAKECLERQSNGPELTPVLDDVSKYDFTPPTDLIPRITIRDHHDADILFQALTNLATTTANAVSTAYATVDSLTKILPAGLLEDLVEAADKDAHYSWHVAMLAEAVGVIHDAFDTEHKVLPDGPQLAYTDPHGLHDTAEQKAACKHC